MLPTGRALAEDASFEGRLADLLLAGYRLACGMLHDPTNELQTDWERALRQEELVPIDPLP
jgi:hypothetical protein